MLSYQIRIILIKINDKITANQGFARNPAHEYKYKIYYAYVQISDKNTKPSLNIEL